MSTNKKIKAFIDRWEDKKIITQKQKDLMIKDLNSESQASHFFKIIATIGAIFMGLGAILLISSNWEYLPKIIKLILILLMPIGSLGLGYYLSYVKEDYKKIGNSFIFLGSFLIGSSLALLGQLYNLDGSVARLLLWWFLLTIPITFMFKFKTLAALTGSLFYLTIFNFIIDNFFRDLDGNHVVLLFSLVSSLVIGTSFYIKKKFEKDSQKIFDMFEVISFKVLFLTLYIGTIDDEFYLLGDLFFSGFFQNALFLGVIFLVMWFSNKNYSLFLRNSTFFWLGLYMITKYFTWLWDYMEVGLFFVLFGLFLILLVFGYIKGTKYLEKVKNEKK